MITPSLVLFSTARTQGSEEETGEICETTFEDIGQLVAEATSGIITPGFGMDFAQAQYPVAEFAACSANGARTWDSASIPSPGALLGT